MTSPALQSFKNLFDLTGRVALVTGAGAPGGFGQLIAWAFAEYGCQVAAADLDCQGANLTAEGVVARGQRALALQADLGEPAEVESMVMATLEAFETIDILVNCGGMSQHDPSETMPLAAWDRVIDVNLRGTFLCCQLAGCAMLDRGRGSVVNFSSISGAAGYPRGVAAYSASKGGVDALTRQLAVEWASRGVRVNSIAPCQFLTPGLEEVMRIPQFEAQRMMRTWTANIPLGRVGRAEEIVGAVLFLASDASSMVTGITLPVDGGYLAR